MACCDPQRNGYRPVTVGEHDEPAEVVINKVEYTGHLGRSRVLGSAILAGTMTGR